MLPCPALPSLPCSAPQKKDDVRTNYQLYLNRWAALRCAVLWHGGGGSGAVVRCAKASHVQRSAPDASRRRCDRVPCAYRSPTSEIQSPPPPLVVPD